MHYLLINIVLALVWTFLTGEPTLGSFLIGMFLGYFALLPYRKIHNTGDYSYRVVHFFRFGCLFFVALVRATVDVVYEILTPTHYMQPGVVALDITGMSPLAILILANAITLTPGTMTLAVSRTRNCLYIHAMYASDPDAVVKDIERYLKQPLLRFLPPIKPGDGSPNYPAGKENN